MRCTYLFKNEMFLPMYVCLFSSIFSLFSSLFSFPFIFVVQYSARCKYVLFVFHQIFVNFIHFFLGAVGWLADSTGRPFFQLFFLFQIFLSSANKRLAAVRHVPATMCDVMPSNTHRWPIWILCCRCVFESKCFRHTTQRTHARAPWFGGQTLI